MDSVRPLPQNHSRYAVILSYHDITFCALIHQCKIHGIRASSYDFYLTVGRLENMAGITQEHYRNLILLRCLFHQFHYRTCVRIY